MSALGDHAASELDYLGIPEPERGNLITIVGSFSDSADIPTALAKVQLLLQFKPLTELTNNPAEWALRDTLVLGQQVWQSKRYPDAWTYDSNFNVYFLLSGHNGGNSGPFNTVPYEES